MPKEVDHELRRRELADAVCRVVAREGLAGVSLRLVSDEAGWSIGSMRYYFTTKDELLEFGLRRAGDRIEDRLAQLCEEPTMIMRMRSVVRELLPLDDTRREEALVWLAVVSQAAMDPRLATLADEVWVRLNAAITGLVRSAVDAGEMPRTLDVRREGTRLQALIDGLVVHLAAMPGQMSHETALHIVDAHIDGLHDAELSDEVA